MRKIILASTSPRRKELFGQLKIPFVVESSNYEENMNLRLKPIDLAKKLSSGKAEAVAAGKEDAIVIGADTLVFLKNKVLGKPRTNLQAEKMLKSLNGKVHVVITGFTIIDTKTKKKISKAIETKVYFRKVNDQEIKAYVKTKEPIDKAGAYGLQGFGSVLVRKIEGDYFNVVGLPLAALAEELKKFGVSPFA